MSVKSPVALRFPLSIYPGLNPFALDLVQGKELPSRFVHRDPLGSVTPARTPAARSALVRELEETNRRWGNDVTTALRRWERGQTATLIAGQQVGIGGGPLYTFAKIVSLLSLQQRFQGRGVDSTLFFWMATEDHDYDEVSALLLERGGVLEQVRSPRPGSRSERRLVGPHPIPSQLRHQLTEMLGAEPSWLKQAATFRDAFAMLLAQVFPGRIVLVDSLLPSLRRQGSPLLASLARGLEEAEALVRDRSMQLEAAGYSAQIVKGEGEHYPFLFHVDHNNIRHPIQCSKGAWTIGERTVSEEQIGRLIESAPESISTGAVSRPLLQDYVFQPDVFIGGPAEVAYYAQLGGLYETFQIRQPHVALRGHLLFADAKRLRAFERYEVSLEELFTGAQELIARLDPEPLKELDQRGREGKRQMDESISRIEELILPADRSLERSIHRSRRHLRYHMEKLLERGRAAVARRDAIRFQSLDRLHRQLLPGGVPQDRLVGWLPFWLEFGNDLVERAVDVIQPDSEWGVVIGLPP